MPSVLRPKACIACADSKRKCDKKLPECERCLDRDIDCVYPQLKRRRRETNDQHNQDIDTDVFSNYVNAHTLGDDLDFAEWSTIETPDLDFSMPIPEVMNPYVSTLLTFGINSSSQHPTLQTATNPWILEDETWVMQHCKSEPGCVEIDMNPFVSAVEEMLQAWVKDGHNAFIHHRLFDKGMPTCLQDAFTTFAAYTGQAKKETVLQIAEERSYALVGQEQHNVSGIEGILAHLARVLALFVYEFMRLFDGSVRLRASAERQLPTLRTWVIEMWQAANTYRGEHGFSLLQQITSESDYGDCSELWKVWILTETVRRTQVIIDTIANTYETMTRGWAECTGAAMITGRTGLWDAQSAVKWYDLTCRSAQVPLLVSSLEAGSLISGHRAEEFDDLVKMFWRFTVGPDKIQCWIDSSTNKNSGNNLF
ncbi:hypothetical protein BT63DRAFT_420740 [Microthyrium microscopicum]|uniref:Zn(2)-C6 fungal-type domain-containing protein n=1 Tax=Microthyrium microscopicum TaxID=703497 RepID=A0A6A6UX32_9PEZI|nr:hypothetical protein BT63DRAFT_420740 [Microthyrium microscopicum]